MKQSDYFKDYFDAVEASSEAKVEWEDNIVTITLSDYGGRKLVRKFNAEYANLQKIGGSKYADYLYRRMVSEFYVE